MATHAPSHRRARGRAAPVPPLQSVPPAPRGSLVIIGGHERKNGSRPILEELARRVGDGRLVVATLASEEPDDQFEDYRDTFKALGTRRIVQLDARRREDLLRHPKLNALE